MQPEDKPGPFIPPIPADAPRAEHHAPPVDLTKPANEPKPSKAVPDTDDSASSNGNSASARPDQEPDSYFQPSAGYRSPEPIEAMFAQLRADQKRLERTMLITTAAMLGACLLLAWMVQHGGVENVDLSE